MNWEAVGALGETIGALAVLVTLIFLIIQIRQNTKALAFQNSRNSLNALMTISNSTMNTEVSEILRKAYTDQGGLSSQELQIVDTYVYGVISILHQDYLEYSEGLHSERWWKLREHGIRRVLWSETPRKLWANYTHEDFDKEFMAVVEEVLSKNVPGNYYQDIL